MAACFSEVGYQYAPPNFLKAAVPAGTIVSGYSILIYDASGVLETRIAFPAHEATMFGRGVYSFDEITPGNGEYGANEAISFRSRQEGIIHQPTCRRKDKHRSEGSQQP